MTYQHENGYLMPSSDYKMHAVPTSMHEGERGSPKEKLTGKRKRKREEGELRKMV
jgi:hypothetical protein